MNDISICIREFLNNFFLSDDKLAINLMSLSDREIFDMLNTVFQEYISKSTDDTTHLPTECTVRNHQNRYNRKLEKLVLIKNINLDSDSSEDAKVTSVIYFNENNAVKYYQLLELDNRVLPKSYIKKNERFLLVEIDKDFKQKSWGKLLNPRNLSDIVNSISLVNR